MSVEDGDVVASWLDVEEAEDMALGDEDRALELASWLDVEAVEEAEEMTVVVLVTGVGLDRVLLMWACTAVMSE